MDEAHNLLETISSVHSSILSYAQVSFVCGFNFIFYFIVFKVCGAHSQLSQYLNRYKTRLSSKNCLYLQQILFFLKAFMKLFGKGKSIK